MLKTCPLRRVLRVRPLGFAASGLPSENSPPLLSPTHQTCQPQGPVADTPSSHCIPPCRGSLGGKSWATPWICPCCLLPHPLLPSAPASSFPTPFPLVPLTSLTVSVPVADLPLLLPKDRQAGAGHWGNQVKQGIKAGIINVTSITSSK